MNDRLILITSFISAVLGILLVFNFSSSTFLIFVATVLIIFFLINYASRRSQLRTFGHDNAFVPSAVTALILTMIPVIIGLVIGYVLQFLGFAITI
jgi:hypothetical protein